VSLFCKTRTIESAQLNQEPTVIGTGVGVVDMDNGRLLTDLEGYEDDAKRWHVTKACRGEVMSRFNQDPTYDDRWDKFILEIMCGDKQRADYLQRALGYSMLGSNPEEVMFIAYGASTRNGKGTLLNTISWVLGDYAANMPSDFLTRTKQRSSSDDDALGTLESKRFVTMSEPTAGRKLDEAKVKSLTGNDPITVARKYCPTTTFYPQFTMWLSCNRLPSVEDTTVFTSGRIRVIPFERHFSKEEQDSTLKNRFRTKDGAYTVLTWLLEGYEKWKKKGLEEPMSIVEATSIFANSGGDDFQKFVDCECVIETSAKIKVRELCDTYKQWASDNDCEVLTDKDIKAKLKAMSIPSRRSTGGHFYYIGIRLSEPSKEVHSSEGKVHSSEVKSSPKRKPKANTKPKVKLGVHSSEVKVK
jgi:putative DNA primase/helicase